MGIRHRQNAFAVDGRLTCLVVHGEGAVKRTLKQRHMAMIALGGSIGTCHSCNPIQPGRCSSDVPEHVESHSVLQTQNRSRPALKFSARANCEL